MHIPNEESIRHLREVEYPPGTRLELVHMADPYAPVPPGTKGTVRLVDDMGQIHMQWDNGRTLALVPGEDQFRRLSAPEPVQNEEITMGGM